MPEELATSQSRFLSGREPFESRRLRAWNLRLAALEEEAGSHRGEMQREILPRGINYRV